MARARSKLHVAAAELLASAFMVGDRNPLHSVAVDSHVRDCGDVFDHKPFGPAFGDDPGCVLEHFAAVLHAGMIRIPAVCVRHRKALTRRARHDAVEATSDAGEFTDVTAGDFVRSLDDTKSSRCECTVEQTYAGE